MCRRIITQAMLVCTATLLVTDVASGQIFRRVWERRKSELRSELSYQLRAKLDADLSREVGEVRQALTEEAKVQVAAEAEQLRNQVASELKMLREQASQIVATEADRLSKETKQHLETLRKAADERITAETTKLAKQTENALAQLRTEHADTAKSLQAMVDTQMAKVPANISDEVKKQLAEKQADDQESDDQESDKEKKTAATQEENALKTEEVKLQENKEPAQGG